MTNKEAIETIKCAIAQVEWDYPMDYVAAFNKAMEALEKEEAGWISVNDRLPGSMMQTMRPENPAKTYLKRYRALVIQRDSLQRSIDAAYDRAYSCTHRLKPIRVQGGGSAYDRMAEDVARISDETEKLKAAKERAEAALAEIMSAIQAVPDEMQRTVLLLRYVEGLDWISLADKIGYEERQAFIIHGRALWTVRKWLETAQENAVVKVL